MARTAMIEDASSIVVNVVDWSPDMGLAAPPGHTLIPDELPAASPGGRWDGSKFIPPPGLVVVPEEPA